MYAVPSPSEGELKNIGISIGVLPSELVILKSEVIVGKVAPPPPPPEPPGLLFLYSLKSVVTLFTAVFISFTLYPISVYEFSLLFVS